MNYDFYKPLNERLPDQKRMVPDTHSTDTQYQDAVRRVKEEGEYMKHPKMANGRYAHFSLNPLVYDYANGIPLLTERNIPFWRKSIGELLAFIHGVRHLKDLEPWQCANFWADFVTEEKCAIFGLVPGDLGGASYGGIYHDFPIPDPEKKDPEGKTFNQFYHLIKQIQWEPSLSTHMVTSWYPPGTLQHDELQRKVVVAPCHGDLIKVSIIGKEKGKPGGKLTLTQVQRSGDMPIGVPSNIFQYAALGLMLAQVTDTVPYRYVHYFLDAQIYDNQLENVQEILERKAKPFPVLKIKNPDIRDIFEFKIDDFELEEYDPNPSIKGIPVTI